MRKYNAIKNAVNFGKGKMSNTKGTHVSVTCSKCGSVDCFYVENEDLHAWKNGALIQDAMPYLNADQREMLISKTCNECWNLMFPND